MTGTAGGGTPGGEVPGHDVPGGEALSSTAVTSTAPTRGARTGERARTVVAGLVVGAAIMVAGSVAWVRATTSSAVEATVDLTITGSVVAPAVNAGGLVILAAACALALGGVWGRRLAAGGIVVGGLLAAVSGVAGMADPRAAALSAARETVGVAVLDGPVTTTPVPWVATVLGLVAVTLGARTIWVTGRWGAASARHEVGRPSGPQGTPSDHGRTQGTGRTSGRDGSANGDERAGTAGHARTTDPADPGEQSEPVDVYDAWDALSRGQDPT